MLTKLFICLFAFKAVSAQINGEFWWLNNKLIKLYKVEPPQPKFEDIGEFDTDESAKVVFRDDPFEVTRKNETFSDTTTAKTEDIEAIIYFRDNSKLIEPVEVTNKSDTIPQQIHNSRIDTVDNIKVENKNYKEDVFNFIFPDDAASFKTENNNMNKGYTISLEKLAPNSVNKSENLNNKILNNTEKNVSLAEDICSYMTKSECNRCNGFPYIPEKELNSLKFTIRGQNICCILPLTKPKSSKIRFPDIVNYDTSRIKRSNNEDISPALKQRKTLLERKYGSQTTASTVAQKIVTPEEEYIDPYLNIKNPNFNNKQEDYKTGSSQDYNNDYFYNDYYTAELPKPSLVGLYSDHRPTGWSFIHPYKEVSYINDESDEEIQPFGYSTIDPRQGSSIDSNLKPRLLKLSNSSERILNSESQTVSYHSNPDFRVLEGFKLLNLKNKIKPPPVRILRRTTTESLPDSVEEMFHSESSVDDDYDDYMEVTESLYKNCGRTKEAMDQSYKCDSTLGEYAREAHPWLLFVTLTKRRKSILCYATLVHPRAAVTSADCTYEMNDEITLVAGAWDLKEEKRGHLQYRKPSIRVHQQYRPGKLAYNIALLYWRRPLRLDTHVQPACVSDYDTAKDCIFVGWGGYDQAIRQRPRWQRASILSPQNCAERISEQNEFDLPIDTFCASVDSKTTVTGPGGPLMCKDKDIFSVVGFSVWRNDVVVLMRPQEWTTRAMASLRIN